jgi:hypothetical protein
MSWVTKPDRETAGFIDSASWEEVRKAGDDNIKRWIDRQLDGTSVTCVLIGAETNERKYVQYEIQTSVNKGNGLLGIFIHGLKNKDGYSDNKGINPLDYWAIEENGRKIPLSRHFKTYDWLSDNGYNNLGDWVEEAARTVGR